jgi:nucleoside-diphosphate-sugar epimerase
MRIGVTGATGYVGRHFVSYARRQGHELVALGRRAIPGIAEHRTADLRFAPPDGLVDGLDAVVHLAADTNGTMEAGAEVLFARALAQACAGTGVRLLVTSSQAASASAPSSYGRVKAAIEAEVMPAGAVVVRPGLVYGASPGGLFGLLVATVRTLPLIPDLRPAPMVQPIHVDDLSAAMLRLVSGTYPSDRVWKLAGAPLEFGEFLALLARHRLRRSKRRIPVPVSMLRAALRAGQRVVGPRLSPERLDSLVQLPMLESTPDLAALGVEIRPLADGLSPGDPQRRGLLREGSSLMSAFASGRPTRFASRRYARALHALGCARALHWPPLMLAQPALIAALDTPAFRSRGDIGGAAWRVGVALRVLETQPSMAGAFIAAPGRAGHLRMARDFAMAAVAEMQMRVLAPVARLIAGPLL